MCGMTFQTRMLHALKPTTLSFTPPEQQPVFLSSLMRLIEHSSTSQKVKPVTTRMKAQHRLRNTKTGCFSAVCIILMPTTLLRSRTPSTGVSQQELFLLISSESAQHGSRQSTEKLTIALTHHGIVNYPLLISAPSMWNRKKPMTSSVIIMSRSLQATTPLHYI